MNFGPLNRDGGERRLNVLITRAKNRCEVFSSIVADDVDLSRSNKRGVVALKTFLKYAQTGIMGVPDAYDGTEPESPFEEAVKAALEKHGYEVRPQVGTAGFFIDLAIVDPDNPGRYLIGIACDGASYHSARSARERDRQRQTVLEDHGWTIHRIWSTNWFQRPEEQMKAALEAVEAARRKAQEVGVPHEKELDEVDDLDDAEEPTLVVEREPMVAAGDDQEVDETYTFSSYKEARFRVPTTVDIPDVPISVMNDIVEKIIRVEAPIHVDEVVQRVRLLWGLGRAGRLIREAVVAAVANFERSEDSVPQGDGFLMHRNAKLRIRSRNGVDSSTLRKPEYLPPAEIDAAIVDLTKAMSRSPGEGGGQGSRRRIRLWLA